MSVQKSGIMGFPPSYKASPCRLPGTFHSGSNDSTHICYVTTEAVLHPTLENGVLPSADLRKALNGHWLYLVGDSSTRGLFVTLLQQVANVSGGSVMDTTHWFGSTLDLKDVAYADIILNASDGSRLGALSKGCPNAVKKQCIKPFLDGAMDPKRAHAFGGSLSRQWCMIETNTRSPHPASTSVCHVKGAHVPQPQRCVHKTAAPGDNQTRALALCPSLELQFEQDKHESSQPGLLSRRTDEETDEEHQSSDRSTTGRSSAQGSSTREPIRRCSVATGMLRLTYRFAAYASGLAQDAFLELRTRFLLHPCSLMTKQPTKQASPLMPSAHVLLTRAPDLHFLQTGSWDNAAAALNPLQSSWDLFEVRLAASD